MLNLDARMKKYLDKIEHLDLVKVNGRVTQVIGLVIESIGPSASLGEVCAIKSRNDEVICLAEVVGFKNNRVLSMALGDINRISPGSEIVAMGKTFSIPVGRKLLGRVIDGLGHPIDGKGWIEADEMRSIYNQPPAPLERSRITQPIATGIRAIDSLLTCGKGQRIGIFAGSGVGKSTLMGMIARHSNADVNVIALIGERGREVRDFIEKELGDSGLSKSVVVVATSDKPPLIRVKSALVATAIAEYFRDQGFDVMFMMDSLTRVAMAQREVGLAIGEPPTTKGYTPSVFALLPKLVERAGTSSKGSITALYTVLVEGDDFNEPIADFSRSILDGHIVLSRKLANMGHYPAIEPLESISRLMPDIVSSEHKKSAEKIIDILATYREAEDLINIGAYVRGSNPKIDKALQMIEKIREFLRQDMKEKAEFEDSVNRLIELAKLI
ncbi:type III secretion system ATPase, FliI/YscN [Candidatus Kryptonium thompsonii]|jgi:flagellum-specific ATP synthase|uniref:Type III secretion system ATPase, FliI/YscN n=3 Tax=Candidatus Kryptonium thompsonii TaxID=1633631 RepID=A0A0P1MDF5_9BACT|nr:flagellar protein export ATPase FliI [Candidatus Kryptonium thompsoni]CUS76824.1 type III secretion system ATPase, FliI/YscN [Candidatus Kryptonium thompsoni]CUS77174.1 type III secretion system ATPase, FliI/YscN [Candidatus Kryptonium thompsoni]CUS79156.1 type III secretion system ATPase, FliI/YscN [Candidatus Kryptonium thompsoni]CUS82534.1 type III secretion system ATPase, FliI/YscN [Candidatus Kryptonium thompsoni]CUS92868.1 type III secretion system ATPase, FliI/YscN [Candidatus Krypto